jgi:hypothetical protein
MTDDIIDTLSHFVIDRTGQVLVYAGLYQDGDTWRHDTPVVGWALRTRTWKDGTSETDIVSLVMQEDGSYPTLVPPELLVDPDFKDEPITVLPVYTLPPNPTADDLAAADAAVTEYLDHKRIRLQKLAKTSTP